MNAVVVSVFTILIASCAAQRSPYAGRSPIGYPSLSPTNTAADSLGNRFGEVGTTTTTTTTERLPIEARGDAELVKRLRKLPVDQQPFWLINWQALDTYRKNPKTYNPRGNGFVDSNVLNFRG